MFVVVKVANCHDLDPLAKGIIYQAITDFVKPYCQMRSDYYNLPFWGLLQIWNCSLNCFKLKPLSSKMYFSEALVKLQIKAVKRARINY